MAATQSEPGLESGGDTAAHGHTVVVAPQTRERVLTWRDKNSCARPVSFSVSQQLRRSVAGVLPALLFPDALVDQDVPGVDRLIDSLDVAADIRLEVHWGNGGTQHRAYLDLDRSTSFQLVASWASISAIYLGIGDLAVATLPNVCVSATAGEAATYALPPPRLTVRIAGPLATDTVLAPFGVIVAVPRFAYEALPSVPYPPGPGQAILQELNAAGALLWQARFGDDSPDRKMLLDNACKAIRFSHTFSDPLARAGLIFNLALG